MAASGCTPVGYHLRSLPRVDSAFHWAPSLPSALLSWPPVQLSLGCLVSLPLGLWSQHSHTFSSHLLTQSFGLHFHRRKKAKRKEDLVVLKSGFFDSFLKVCYTLLQCPRKILLCDNHSTEQFHQAVLLAFLVSRFKSQHGWRNYADIYEWIK